MNIRKSLNESRIGKLVNESAPRQAFENLMDGVSSYLKDCFVDTSFADQKQAILDFMDHIASPEYQAQFASVRPVQLPAFYNRPEISDPIEQRISSVSGMYNVGADSQTLDTRI